MIYVAIGVGVALCGSVPLVVFRVRGALSGLDVSLFWLSGVIAAALLMYRRSSTRGKGPETGLPTVTPDGTRLAHAAPTRFLACCSAVRQMSLTARGTARAD